MLPAEREEMREQLRVLHHGGRIHVDAVPRAFRALTARFVQPAGGPVDPGGKSDE